MDDETGTKCTQFCTQVAGHAFGGILSFLDKISVERLEKMENGHSIWNL